MKNFTLPLVFLGLPSLLQAQDCVVLLHGIARHSGSMVTMEQTLKNHGYITLNLDYPSREKSLTDISTFLHPSISEFGNHCQGQLHFVTHSMGGLVARTYITRYAPTNLGNVVMLGPPNQGSELADTLSKNPAYQWFFGPAGQELRTQQPPELLKSLGHITYPLGIIAGTSSINWPASYWFLPADDDGAVTTARTRVEGQADFLSLPVNHTFMMNDARAISETLYFLSSKRFNATY